MGRQEEVSQSALTFPALGFCPIDTEAHSKFERLISFVDTEDFSVDPAWRFEHYPRLGMTVADTSGRCWQVIEVRDLGVTGSFWTRMLRSLFQQNLRRISVQLIELDRLSLDQIKARVCEAIQARPGEWRDDEAIAGEDDAPRSEQDMLNELKEAVRRVETLPQLIDLVG